VLVAALAVLAGPAGAQGPKTRQFQHVLERARSEGTVRILVHLEIPHLAALTKASVASRQPADADRRLADSISLQAGRLRAALSGTGHRVHRTFRTVPMMALRASEDALRVLQDSPAVLGVHEDLLLEPHLDGTVPLVGAHGAWADGWNGNGWSVAVLDTGIRAGHDFFTDKDIVQACFASGADGDPGSGGDCPNGLAEDIVSADAARHHPSHFTNYDHGTLVAGPAVGRDPSAFQVPRHGVAPGADIIAVQVYSRFENDPLCGVVDDCVLSYMSDQIAGLEFVYSLRMGLRIAAVNMSIGGGRYFDQASCNAAFAGVEAVVANLRAAGIPTIMSTGNNGFCDSLQGPSCISSAIAVGATDDADVEAAFSNYHPGMTDVFAPGVSILTSLGSGDGDYAARGGTSLAAPHVAGAWAVAKHAFPGAGVDQVLAVLLGTGETGLTYRCGAGGQPRIRIDAALEGLGPAPIPLLSTLGMLMFGGALLLAGVRLLGRRGSR
jgi:subtilisin family serine protease